jgi:putative SOS response-associated peptidase YedK
MPVILDPADYVRWLTQRPATANELQAMLKPFPVERMECFKVGPRIGNVKYDEPGLVEPLAGQSRPRQPCSDVLIMF